MSRSYVVMGHLNPVWISSKIVEKGNLQVEFFSTLIFSSDIVVKAITIKSILDIVGFKNIFNNVVPGISSLKK